MGKTIKHIIERVDRQKPNDFSTEEKLEWISELDGRLALEVCLMDIAQVQEFDYLYPECLDHEPLVPFPHDSIYDHWLGAMIDYKNGEYDKYQNAMEQFNAHYDSFAVWFITTYRPAKGYKGE